MIVESKFREYRTKFLLYVVLVMFAAIFVLPLIFMIMSSLKPNLQMLRDTASLRAFIPVGDISLSNYVGAFNTAPILLFMFNSILITVVTVLVGLVVNSLAAFSFHFLRWRGRHLILSIIIATFIVPFETIAVPLLLLVNKLPWIGPEGFTQGWLNSYHVQIIPLLAWPFQIFLFYQFFREIPNDLVEAAHIDGAGWFKIYCQVVIPVSGPVIATASILRSLDMWNQYMWPMMVVQSERFRPVLIGLQYFFQLGFVDWSEIMAYLSVVTLPIIIFYLLMQRAFIESIASTGIKG